MTNRNYDPMFENQYLESDYYDPEDSSHEDLESLYEDLEGGDFEDPEMMYEDLEDPETWESGDGEGDQFFGALKIAKPFLRKIVPNLAAKLGSRIAGRRGAGIAQLIARNVLREAEMEGDHELEAEGDPEAELEAMGVDPEILAEMAHLAQMAMETDHEGEADQFIGGLANMAGNLFSSLLGETDQYNYEYEDQEEEADHFLPLLGLAAKPLIGGLAKTVGKKLLGKGVKTLGNLLRRSPKTRKLLPAVPRMAASAARSVSSAVRAAQKSRRPITVPAVAGAVNKALARSVATTLASPRRVQAAVVRGRALARRFRFSGTVTLRPVRRRRISRR
jgi:hypothetical protein